MRYPKDHVSTFNGVRYRKERRCKRIEQGLCTKCDNPAVQGHTECSECLVEMKNRAMRSREERRKRGECIQCGKPASLGNLRCEIHCLRMSANGKELQRARKTAVMSHYGKNGKAVCRWPACQVSDLDMLTLDHVANNGAEHRRAYSKAGRGGGTQLYMMLEKQGYPPGYQTLCMNHNFKKHLLAVRAR